MLNPDHTLLTGMKQLNLKGVSYSFWTVLYNNMVKGSSPSHILKIYVYCAKQVTSYPMISERSYMHRK